MRKQDVAWICVCKQGIEQVVKVAVAIAIASTFSLRADLVIHLPLDGTLANGGTMGGTAVRTNICGTAAISTVYSSITNDAVIGSAAENFRFGYYEGWKNVVGVLALPDIQPYFDPSTVSTDTAMTISAWVKWRGPVGPQAWSGASIFSTSWSYFWFAKDGTLKYSMPRATSSMGASGLDAIPSNMWVHVACRWSKKLPNYAWFFVNGHKTQSNYSGSGAFVYAPLTTVFGAVNGNADEGWRSPVNGLLDDVAFWNEDVSDGKIKSLSTVHPLFPTYDTGVMDRLWRLHDSGNVESEIILGKYRWKYTEVLPAGYSAGDVWIQQGSQKAYIQLTAQTGLVGIPPPAGTMLKLY